ncbi:hypothetical protein V6N13_061964 [Hibiscus sabdariffa]
MTCVACVGSVEGIWRNLPGASRKIEHADFGSSLVQSNELDLQLLEIFRVLKGVYNFHFDRIFEELEAFFSEVVDSSVKLDVIIVVENSVGLKTLAACTDEEIIEQLKKHMNSQMSVYVVNTSLVLASRFFLNAKQLGMISQEYTWVTTDVVTYFMDPMDSSVIEFYEGKFIVTVEPSVQKANDAEKLKFKFGVALENSWISPEDFGFA